MLMRNRTPETENFIRAAVYLHLLSHSQATDARQQVRGALLPALALAFLDEDHHCLRCCLLAIFRQYFQL